MTDSQGPSGNEPSRPVPHRDLRDPQTLRALAHPVRLRLLDQLMERGPATATELSARIGDSPANCSWHLRHLARYGFIEQTEGEDRRNRPWRVVRETASFAHHDDEPELAAAEEAAAEVILGRELEALAAWRRSKADDSVAWRDASLEFQLRGWMTASELAAFRDELAALIQRHLLPNPARVDPSQRPPGCRPVRLVTWAIPGSADTETSPG